MVGDENPPVDNKNKDLAGLETKADVEQNQRSTNLGVSSFQADLYAHARQVQPCVQEAAMWLHLNHRLISGSAIVATRRRFALTVMEASEAAKIAHRLSADGGAQ